MLDAAISAPDVAALALAGLTATPKTLPSKLFYDAAGIALFEAITKLPEYYLTRTELALLHAHAAEISGLAPQRATLVEYGASDEAKARILLDAAPGRFAAYLPVDVAETALGEMRERLAVRMPELAVHPICADFQESLVLPKLGGPAFGFFPGSTIGNLEPAVARAFLGQAAATLGAGAWLIAGADLRKDPAILLPAYDDAQGVTAAFNLNLLHRLNREAAADFDVSAFSHRAVWNDAESRIEMHLVSRRKQQARLAGTVLHFALGETIHTENSYKHSMAAFQALAAGAGWQNARVWTDAEAKFAVHALHRGA